MPEVYTEPIARRHFAPRMSAASAFRPLGVAVSLVVAWVVAYSTGDLWLKINSYHEQPEVRFTYDALLILEGAAAGDEKVWSSYDVLMAGVAPASRLAVDVSASETDVNHDGKVDLIDVLITGKGMSPVHGVKLLLTFDYKLDARVDLEMTSLAYVQHSSATPGAELHVDGDLVFRQRKWLSTYKKRNDYDDPILDFGRTEGSLRSASAYSLPVIFNAYLARNETTYLQADHPVWIAGDASTSAGFSITARVRVPPGQEIVYRPDGMEALKFGWVQILAILIIFLWILNAAEYVAFHYRIIPTRVVSDLAPKTQRF